VKVHVCFHQKLFFIQDEKRAPVFTRLQKSIFAGIKDM
jgi:hypothetical protein